jgi:hypothetical protein
MKVQYFKSFRRSMDLKEKKCHVTTSAKSGPSALQTNYALQLAPKKAFAAFTKEIYVCSVFQIL